MGMDIDIYQDVVCPWCRIGKAHLEQALADWHGEPVNVRFHPFQLEPDAGESPEPLVNHFRRRGMGGDVSAVTAPVVRAGAAAGLHFNFETEQMVNTFNAHRLFALVPEANHAALIDALHTALFEHGANVNDLATLADIAAGIGEDREGVLTALQSSAGIDETRAALNRAQGIVQGGVPFFVIDNRYALSGAQPAATIRAALDQVERERTTSLSSVGSAD